ncbi:hypothetical protein ACMU_07400 [Actibacterium mucosum KCTC 23349]|uniref:Cytochrome c domain-containing protein n=1 Tax=Actibacterium mucosum KCTC 23349 TaxID=1454373 RepID=A0A037ZJY0_9RHOB|nr:cytochrome c [Actibacterium mucosum]KAJ56755.1 hypothetical protein ACMU_07400 [Actibacterium mucosum KCTC 23349]
MGRILRILIGLGIVGAAAFWVMTAPESLSEDSISGLEPNVTNGETVFYAAGCASCHAAPNATGEDKLVLAGGQKFPSPFGTFVAPNISPSEAGIGGWSTIDLVNAVKLGVSPDGAHYFSAFPYTSYGRAELKDLVDLKAFLDTLPADSTPNQPHDVSFPFNIRRSLGGWKLLFGGTGWVMADDALSPELERGRYLVEALGHCGECHTPRNALGGLDRARWMGGAPDPSGKGRVPNITSAALTWSPEDVAYYLESGFTPEFDSAGGHMAHVIENTAKLSPEDRAAIAAYLQAIPAVSKAAE